MQNFEIKYKERGIEDSMNIQATSILSAINDFYHKKGLFHITQVREYNIEDFMEEHGLGEEDIVNDITMPHER